MQIGKNKLTIIFLEPLTSSDKISDFIIRSLNDFNGEKIYEKILNNIENFKTVERLIIIGIFPLCILISHIQKGILVLERYISENSSHSKNFNF